MNPLLEHANLFPWIGFLIGACLGSFLNVVAFRVPRNLSVVKPRSSCPACDVSIPWFLNIPGVSWLILKGKARCCGAKISPRYWVVEMVLGFSFAWIFNSYLGHQDTGILIASAIFIWLLIGVIVIDLETMLIPDRFSMGGAGLGFFLSLCFPSIHQVDFHPLGMESLLAGMHSFVGILIGSGLLYWIGSVAGRAFGRDALGEGDIKLLGCVGAFCGWQGAIFCIFGGAVLGCVLLIPFLLWQKIIFSKQNDVENEPLGFGMEIPFGPYLALAALGYFFGLSKWVDPWFSWNAHLAF
jgi:leader peptidase (prepilin peptidase)/N-methyltransferase